MLDKEYNLYPPKFRNAFTYLMTNEAGFTDDPDDLGGITHHGITQASYSSYIGHKASRAEMLEIDKLVAILFYYKEYWKHYHLDQIDDQAAVTAVLDVMVNCGPAGGAELIQRACGAIVDDEMGPVTIAKINETNIHDFIDKLSSELEEHYRKVIAAKPDQKKYAIGWYRRAMKLLSLVT